MKEFLTETDKTGAATTSVDIKVNQHFQVFTHILLRGVLFNFTPCKNGNARFTAVPTFI